MRVQPRRGVVRAAAAAALLGGVSTCSPVTATEGDSGRSLLFIGNSLTYANDLPAMVAMVAKADHDSVRVAMVARPNLAVIDHANGATDAVAQIDRGGWSFVVLQQGPTTAAICRDTFVIAAMRLAPHIRAAGARTVVFLPWAPRGRPEALALAGQSAELAARAVGGIVAPVGIGWKNALDADPAAPLYDSDGYHPAPLGTLLAALTLYDRVFGRDVRAVSVETLAQLPALQLTPDRVRALTAAAHAASESLPDDPTTPMPVDTTKVSAGGGPC